MKFLGYIFKGMSLYIFVTIVRMIYGMFTGKVPIEIKTKDGETGYIIGQIVIIVVVGLFAFLLYQYSNKLIKKDQKKIKNES